MEKWCGDFSRIRCSRGDRGAGSSTVLSTTKPADGFRCPTPTDPNSTIAHIWYIWKRVNSTNYASCWAGKTKTTGARWSMDLIRFFTDHANGRLSPANMRDAGTAVGSTSGGATASRGI